MIEITQDMNEALENTNAHKNCIKCQGLKDDDVRCRIRISTLALKEGSEV